MKKIIYLDDDTGRIILYLSTERNAIPMQCSMQFQHECGLAVVSYTPAFLLGFSILVNFGIGEMLD